MSNIKQKVIMRFKNDEFVDQLQTLLMSTGKVKVGGLGIFEIKGIKERLGYDMRSGKRITIKAHNKVSFRPTQKLRDKVQSYE